MFLAKVALHSAVLLCGYVVQVRSVVQPCSGSETRYRRRSATSSRCCGGGHSDEGDWSMIVMVMVMKLILRGGFSWDDAEHQ